VNCGRASGGGTGGSSGTGGGSTITITKEQNIQTTCIEKICNAQGTCQTMPKGNVKNIEDCSNTCNSNADCTNGRIIETKP
jgi:hypothetical protein